MDTVQFGGLLISKSILDAFFPLLGTIIGGLITYFTTRLLDKRNRQMERAEKVKEQKREAIALALEWISPLTDAVMKASLVSVSFQQGRITKEEYRQRQPIGYDLPIKDPPARLRVFLPKGTYPRLLEMIRTFERFYADAMRKDLGSLEQTLDMAANLDTQLKTLSDLLNAEYLQTFD
jgi:hypothetical protein